ncbi:uncharacterized protein K452DRAFT_361210 [Aplosporella prunicola CBS 121167]|uniref:Uncharacterized protein n=1 Tax=Aplosporella prunicola CBS 121167 TaxID=1176127 RepID=A0A6A6B542_9PEZI|nr:uncharacterized protein K452DRAFT_361210 [Aplosporella prunicola CBS 121167]KAF2138533.1 hypothetical protein K452DRAFT_361210 [Aplosporella prunicola CBS 121167]
MMPGMATSLNSYFVPGYGISRAVIQGEIRYHCGPDAIVRPFTHQGRDGFLVTTAGPPLTKVEQNLITYSQAQIQDIKDASREYEERQAQRACDEKETFMNRPVPVSPRSRKSF